MDRYHNGMTATFNEPDALRRLRFDLGLQGAREDYAVVLNEQRGLEERLEVAQLIIRDLDAIAEQYVQGLVALESERRGLPPVVDGVHDMLITRGYSDGLAVAEKLMRGEV